MNVRRLIMEEYRRQAAIPFVWGSADCASFAADCAALILGRDPAAEFRGRYASEREARRFMAEHGWSDMGDFAGSLFRKIPTAQARSGDWAHVRNPDGTDGLGVVHGSAIAVRSQAGLGLVPLTAALAAFRVE